MLVKLQKSNFAQNKNFMYAPFSTPTLNLGGRLYVLNRPIVMGILNVTPDSFYADSRTPDTDAAQIRRRVREIIDEGGDIIDVGACSTRPGADDVNGDEEMRRLSTALAIVREEAPEAIVSVDTWRSEVARGCVEEYGVQMINDISGGELDRGMLRTVARLGVPYVLMHMQGEPRTMQAAPHYEDVVAEVIEYLARRAQRLRDYGGKDIIVDPGFGFGKTLEHNYRLLERLEFFHELNCPLLVGVSRKSMIYRLLGSTPQDALNGTTAIHAFALMKGAHILRVHDVKAAVETCRIFNAMNAAAETAGR